jgi:hypothetical protein
MIISAALATMGHVTVTQRRVERLRGFFLLRLPDLRVAGCAARPRTAEQRDELAPLSPLHEPPSHAGLCHLY